MELDIRNVPMGSRAMASSILNPSLARYILESTHASGKLTSDMAKKMRDQVDRALPSILEQYPCSYDNSTNDGHLLPSTVTHPSDLVNSKLAFENSLPFMCKDTTVYTGYSGIALLLLQLQLRNPSMVARGPRYGRRGAVWDPQTHGSQAEWLRNGQHAHRIAWVEAPVSLWCTWYLEDLLIVTPIPEPATPSRSSRRGSLTKWHWSRRYYRNAIGFLGSNVSVWALAAATCQRIYKDSTKARSYASYVRDIGQHFLCQYDAQDSERQSKAHAELLYGATGWLYTILFLRKHISPEPSGSLWWLDESTNASLVVRMIEWVARRGRDTSRDADIPIPEDAWVWEWHNSAYVGAIHGTIGIITILNRFVYARQKYDRQIDATTRFIGSLKGSNQNYPSEINNDHRYLFHFCHGSPGVCLSLLSIHHHTENPDLKQFCLKEALGLLKSIEANGVLRKGVGLCHGISGNAFPFIMAVLYQSVSTNGERKGKASSESLEAPRGHIGPRQTLTSQLGTALGMASLCFYEEPLTNLAMIGIPDRPYSLFEGRAGAIWLHMVMAYDVLPKWSVRNRRLEFDPLELGAAASDFGFPCYSDV